MKPWQLRTPYACYMVGRHTQIPLLEEMWDALPGVRKDKFKGHWSVPQNVLPIAEGIRGVLGVPVKQVWWGVRPLPALSWEDVREVLLAKGEVRPEYVGDWPKPYQKDAVAFAWARRGVHLWHSTGAGKTWSGVVAALSEDGPVVVITRAASRLQYAREIERFTKLRAYVVRPENQMRPRVTVGGVSWAMFRERMKQRGLDYAEYRQAWKDLKSAQGIDRRQSLQEYVADCIKKKTRPVVVCAWENLSTRVDELIAVGPGSVIFDELHLGRNAKRWDVEQLPPLPLDPTQASKEEAKWKTKFRQRGGFVKRDEETGELKGFSPIKTTASAAALLSRAARKVIGTTATPVANRVRDLWSQLDMVEPNAWGNATSWQTRYAGRKPGRYGGYDTNGAENLVELKKRLEGITHIVGKEQAQAHLPDWRRQSIYLAQEDQCKPSPGFREELKRAQARGPTAILEVELARAASGKRRAVLDLVSDHLSEGKGKVTLFTARRRDSEDLARDLGKFKGIKQAGAPVFLAHGGMGTDVRDEIIKEYMAHPGPCVMVATGYALGTSINLDDTDAAFMVMLPLTPEHLLQWEGRFVRNSMTRKVIIYYVISEGTADEHMACILIDKLPVVGDVVEDSEALAAMKTLAGFDPNESAEDFAASILRDLDLE